MPARLIMAAVEKDRDKSKVHKLSLKGSGKLVAEFVSTYLSSTPDSKPASGQREANGVGTRNQFQYSIHTILYGYPPHLNTPLGTY